MEILPEPSLREQEKEDRLTLTCLQPRNGRGLTVFNPDGSIDAMRYIATGETYLHTARVGDGSTMSFEREVYEPIIDKSYPNKKTFAKGLPKWRTVTQSWYSELLSDEEAEKYSAVISQIKESAQSLFAEHEIDTERTDDCTNCKGKPTEERVFPCWCLQGGDCYVGLDGETVQARDKGVADPDCVQCEGTGEHACVCPTCRGATQVITNPVLSFINGQTEQQASFRLDVPMLIAIGAVDVHVITSTHRQRKPTKHGEVMVSLDFSGLVRAAAKSVGVDPDGEVWQGYWGPQLLERRATTFGKLLRPITVTAPLNKAGKLSKTVLSETMRDLQRHTRASLQDNIYTIDHSNPTLQERQETAAKDFDIAINEKNQPFVFGLRFDKIERSTNALNEAIAILAKYDYRIAAGYTGIATGESGPALYIMDEKGSLIQEVACGYDERFVLNEALQRIRKADHDGLLAIHRLQKEGGFSEE